jgi:hypothetical protein
MTRSRFPSKRKSETGNGDRARRRVGVAALNGGYVTRAELEVPAISSSSRRGRKSGRGLPAKVSYVASSLEFSSARLGQEQQFDSQPFADCWPPPRRGVPSRRIEAIR